MANGSASEFIPEIGLWLNVVGSLQKPTPATSRNPMRSPSRAQTRFMPLVAIDAGRDHCKIGRAPAKKWTAKTRAALEIFAARRPAGVLENVRYEFDDDTG